MAELPIIALGIYRLVTIVIGFLVIFLGYKLFRHGVFEKAGELKAAWGGSSLLIKQAAPGIFFTAFGTLIIIVSLTKGVTIHDNKEYYTTFKLMSSASKISKRVYDSQRVIPEFNSHPESSPQRVLIAKTGTNISFMTGRPLDRVIMLKNDLVTLGICMGSVMTDEDRVNCSQTYLGKYNRSPTASELQDLELWSRDASNGNAEAKRKIDEVMSTLLKNNGGQK